VNFKNDRQVKKPLVLFLCILSLLLVASSLSSCGDKQTNETAPEILEEQLKEHVTLSFYFFGSPDATEQSSTQEVLDEIAQKSDLNIQIDFKWLPINHYIEKIKVIASAQEPIDGFYSFDPSPLAFDFTQLAREGALKDLTSLLPAYAPDLYGQYSEGDLVSAHVDGKLFTVPSLNPLTYGTYAVVREDLKSKYSIPDINSIETYEYYLSVIKENEEMIPGKMAGFVIDQFIGTTDYAVLDPFLALLYDWDDPEMKVLPLEQTQEFLDIVKLITRWNQDEYLHKLTNPSFDIWQEARALMISEEISSFLITPEFNSGQSAEHITFQLNHEMEATSSNQDVLVKAYLLYPEKSVQRVRGPMGLGWTGSATAFSAKSPNVERGLQFLNWIQSSQENYDLLLYGIQGKDYVLENNNIEFPEVLNDSSSLYMDWSGRWAFENVRYSRLPKGFSPSYNEDRKKPLKPRHGLHLMKDFTRTLQGGLSFMRLGPFP